MISVPIFSLGIVAQNAGTAPAAKTVVELPTVCWLVDLMIFSLVLLITLRFIVRYRRTDPFIPWPARPNSVKEDIVLWSLLIFFVVQSILALAFSSLTKDPKNLSAIAFFSLLTGSGTQLIAALACLVMASSRFVGGISVFLLGPSPERLHASFVEPLASTCAESPDEPDVRTAFSHGTVAHSARNWRSQLRITSVVLVLALGLCPVIVEVTMLLTLRFNPEYTFDSHPTLFALQSGVLSSALIVGLWVGAAVIAPLAEEIFFRGLMQTFLVSVLGSRYKAIFVASGVFAMIHFPQQPHAVPALFVLAVLLGYAYEKTGSMIVPVIIHAGFNLKTLIWDWLASVT